MVKSKLQEATNVRQGKGDTTMTTVEIAKRHKLFLELVPTARCVGDAYVGAGYTAKSADVARASGCRLLRKLDAKMGYREIMDSVGLTDRYVAEKIKDGVDNEDGHLSIKALNLATRCKGWQQPNINVGVGVQIVITNQTANQTGDDRTIDVTAISQQNDDGSEQIQD